MGYYGLIQPRKTTSGLDELELGTKVKITHNRRKGVIRGKWHEQNCQVKYLVRYAEADGHMNDFWLIRADLEIAETG